MLKAKVMFFVFFCAHGAAATRLDST